MIPSIEPSKELIAAVLDVKKVFGVSVEEDDTLYIWSTADEQEQNINIHMFANMCKVWAYEKHRDPITSSFSGEGWFSTTGKYYDDTLDGFYADTEQAAVFKAAEWILQPEAGSDDTSEHFLQDPFNPSEPALTITQRKNK